MMTSLYRRPLILAVVCLASLLFGSGCGDLGSFTFTETSQEVTVQGSGLSQLPVDNPFGEALRLNIDLDQELEKQDAEGAEAVYLEGLDLRITEDSDGRDFDFLDQLTFYANADGLDKRQVAIIEDVPSGQSRISLDTDDSVNLKPYIEEGMRLEAEAEGSVPDDDTTLEAIAAIRVKVL
ncbi:MAG: hypothetical protein ACOC9J_04405 [Persicimonas sp.]